MPDVGKRMRRMQFAVRVWQQSVLATDVTSCDAWVPCAATSWRPCCTHAGTHQDMINYL